MAVTGAAGAAAMGEAGASLADDADRPPARSGGGAFNGGRGSKGGALSPAAEDDAARSPQGVGDTFGGVQSRGAAGPPWRLL